VRRFDEILAADFLCTRRWNSRPRGGGIGPLRVAV
jgi:hypothetical protein